MASPRHIEESPFWYLILIIRMFYTFSYWEHQYFEEKGIAFLTSPVIMMSSQKGISMKIDEKKIDFTAVAERLKAYRLLNGFSQDELAQRSGLRQGTIQRIEDSQTYSTMNQYWAIVNSEKLSAEWFFYGTGKWNDVNLDSLPETIIIERGAGIRRNEERASSESGQYVGDSFEFILAIESFKKKNNKPFPTWTEIFELIMSLGYRKVAQQTIHPCKNQKQQR